MKPHKNTNVLKAIADGREIQWRYNGLCDWEDNSSNYRDPITNIHIEWRVKPEKKKVYATVYMTTSGGTGSFSHIDKEKVVNWKGEISSRGLICSEVIEVEIESE